MEKKKVIFWSLVGLAAVTIAIVVIKHNSKKRLETTPPPSDKKTQKTEVSETAKPETPNDDFKGNQGVKVVESDVLGKTGYSKMDNVKVFLLDASGDGDSKYNVAKFFKFAKKDEFIGIIKEISDGKVSDGFVWANAGDLNFK